MRVPIRKNGAYNSTWGRSAKKRTYTGFLPRQWAILEFLRSQQTASIKRLERWAVSDRGWAASLKECSDKALVRNPLKYLEQTGAIRNQTTIGDGVISITSTGLNYLNAPRKYRKPLNKEYEHA